MTTKPKKPRKPAKCPDCGELTKDIHWGPNPYAEEVRGDVTPEWSCSKCRYESGRDV